MPNVPRLAVGHDIDLPVLFMRTMDFRLDARSQSRDMHNSLAAHQLKAEEVIAGPFARPELHHHVHSYGYRLDNLAQFLRTRWNGVTALYTAASARASHG